MAAKISNESIACQLLGRNFVSREEAFGIIVTQSRHIWHLLLEIFCYDEDHPEFKGLKEGPLQMLRDAKAAKLAETQKKCA